MISKLEGEKIALDVHAARPDWPVTSILTALGHSRDRGDMLTIRRAALAAARDPANTTASTISDDGTHWAPIPNGRRPKCPTHDIEINGLGICRCCRADKLASGEELPLTARPRRKGICCGYDHPEWQTCPPTTPMPAWFRAQLRKEDA